MNPNQEKTHKGIGPKPRKRLGNDIPTLVRAHAQFVTACGVPFSTNHSAPSTRNLNIFGDSNPSFAHAQIALAKSCGVPLFNKPSARSSNNLKRLGDKRANDDLCYSKFLVRKTRSIALIPLYCTIRSPSTFRDVVCRANLEASRASATATS